MRSLPALAGSLSFSIALALIGARPAGADVPADPDSIEAHCTPAEQCPSGVVCERAIGDKELGASCRAAAVAKKLERRCSRGATHGEDLYCPAGEKGSWSKDEKAKDAKSSKGCSFGSGESGGAGLLLALAALGRCRPRRRGDAARGR